MSKHLSRPRSIRVINVCSIFVAAILATAIMVTLEFSLSTQREESNINDAYSRCQNATDRFQDSSNFLTNEAREYVQGGNRYALDRYIEGIGRHDQRDEALYTLKQYASNEKTLETLEAALDESETLSETELYALRLATTAHGLKDIPDILQNIELNPQDKALSADKQKEKANDLLCNNDYTRQKLKIRDLVQTCSELLVKNLQESLAEIDYRLSTLLAILRLCVALLVLVVAFVMIATSVLLLKPIRLHEQNIRASKPLDSLGSAELRHLTDAYNEMYEQYHAHTELLDFKAHNDALTGLLNRGSFNTLLTNHKANSALILVDVDNFKQFNDTYGHEMGDAILIEVAATLYSSFRSSDHICRIGGDEFAIIAVGAQQDYASALEAKIRRVAEFLRDESNGLPAATISVGIAFGYEGCSDDGLFQTADSALYEVKTHGRNDIRFALTNPRSGDEDNNAE